MKLTPHEVLEEALASEVGCVVQTSDPRALRLSLTALRSKEIRYLPLTFIISPHNPANELWVVKKVDPYGLAI